MVCATRLLLGAALVAGAAAKPDGTCGYQCTEDSECGGCGTAGKCSCPDGKIAFYQTSCTCVSAPANAPEGDTDVGASVWPTQWTADLSVWNYKDSTDKAEDDSGKFWYDATLDKTRTEWTVGKKGKQVWIGSTATSPKSDYYATIHGLCLRFSITDPGQKGKPVIGIESPDWMKRCNDSGFAKFVGREQVNVNGKDEWVDHWSCRLDYINGLTNQTITFQNWHSLGGNSSKLPKGLPVRVTGGNSVVIQGQAPRMNSVWYTNFVTGENATKDSDFKPPTNLFGLPCTPLSGPKVKSFFGYEPSTDHVVSQAFRQRAAFLPHIKATAKDLSRARRPKPGKAFTGSSFGTAMSKLNAALLGEKGLKTQACRSLAVGKLHEMQRLLFDARTPELDTVYVNAGDTRRMTHADTTSLEKEQAAHVELAKNDVDLAAKVHDGACHEMVMWYIHHLSASAREEVKESLVLPLLPELLHDAPSAEAAPAHQAMHARYTEQASCAICHVAFPASEEKMTVVV